MRSPARVGIVGCGVISRTYAANNAAFDTFDIVACADLETARSAVIAADFGLEAIGVDELLRSDAIDVVLNLTPPAAHASVTRAALEAGKHVYSEKPLGTTVEEARDLADLAESCSLCLGCAPDIFLSGAYQKARALLDDGAIGEPLAVSAAMLSGGQETWHPDPDIFFRDGAGPLLDMGPYYVTAIVSLLGPVRRVAGFASTFVRERIIEIGPRRGERFTAETPTHISSMLELSSGATAMLVATFESPGHYASTMLVHGSEGELALPDPNGFNGRMQIRRRRGDWKAVTYPSRGDADARGLGLHDMVEAIADERAPRASARLATHVVDVARSILDSCDTGTAVVVGSTAERPAAAPVAVVRRPGGQQARR
jgi:predicted dehydrogenase